MLAGFDVSRKEAEDMIMSARVLAGWISADDLPQAVEEEAEVAETAEADAEGDVAES